MMPKGFGKTHPIASNAAQEGAPKEPPSRWLISVMEIPVRRSSIPPLRTNRIANQIPK